MFVSVALFSIYVGGDDAWRQAEDLLIYCLGVAENDVFDL